MESHSQNQYFLHDAEVDCKLCQKGTYNSNTGQGVCIICDVGKYSNQTADTDGCDNCPKGKYLEANPGDGASEHDAEADCKICSAGKYQNLRATTIYGGSNEIQRNIMAKAVLGL